MISWVIIIATFFSPLKCWEEQQIFCGFCCHECFQIDVCWLGHNGDNVIHILSVLWYFLVGIWLNFSLCLYVGIEDSVGSYLKLWNKEMVLFTFSAIPVIILNIYIFLKNASRGCSAFHGLPGLRGRSYAKIIPNLRQAWSLWNSCQMGKADPGGRA